MANSIKTKKNPPPPPPPETPPGELPLHIDRKRQVRLGAGIFFLLLGVFTCFSIISYCYSWSADQDKFFSSGSLAHFLFQDHSPVANWGGRLGAALAHILVYNGVGIAALAIGLAIGSIGANLIYGKKALVLLRYTRWLSIVLLLLAPILTYLFPDAAFPLGGALGTVAISYLNGLLGVAGTGMALLSTVLFFVFVIFALDIRPFVNKMRERAARMAAALKPVQEFDTPNDEAAQEKKEEDANPLPFVTGEPATGKPTPPSGNKLKEAAPIVPFVIEHNIDSKEWEMDMVEKKLAQLGETEDTGEEDTDEHPLTEEEEEYNKWNNTAEHEEEEEITEEEEPEEEYEPVDDEPSFTFEVKQQEQQPTIKHGAHISIASNEPYAPELDLPDYKFPTLDLLENRIEQTISLNKEELERNKDQIVQTLNSFGIEIQNISATVGPTVTLYEVVPGKGVRISKIKNLEDDIALSLAALGIRIIAPIPGKGTIGIEVPNAHKQIVSMMSLLASEKFVNNKMSLPIALGKKIDNENYIVDLATMPHLLMAGATGQGKSVGINAILVSLLYKKHPSQLKFVMVDPK